jgi:hypothetical protein
MTFASPTEHDLSGLPEDFDPRPRWRNAIGAARVPSCFSNNKNGAGVNKVKFLISDDEDEDTDNRTTKTSWCATRHQESTATATTVLFAVATVVAGRLCLAGLVASSKTTTPPKTAKTATTPPPMSFSEAIKKVKVAETATRPGFLHN